MVTIHWSFKKLRDFPKEEKRFYIIFHIKRSAFRILISAGFGLYKEPYKEEMKVWRHQNCYKNKWKDSKSFFFILSSL